MDQLHEIGFRNVGSWRLVNDKPEYNLTDLATSKNVIYAFVSNSEVKYIGKTTMTLKKRMYGYQNPGPKQSTNIKNNRLITEILLGGQEVDILALADNGLLRYANFHINLAAGLEDGLIAELNPEWNGKRNKKGLIASKPRFIQAPKYETSDVPRKILASPVKKYCGKYLPLKDYLTDKQGVNSVVLSFHEIENITGTKLPKSAYTLKEWWSNGGHTQAHAWMQAGWLVDNIDLGKTINFRRYNA